MSKAEKLEESKAKWSIQYLNTLSRNWCLQTTFYVKLIFKNLIVSINLYNSHQYWSQATVGLSRSSNNVSTKLIIQKDEQSSSWVGPFRPPQNNPMQNLSRQKSRCLQNNLSQKSPLPLQNKNQKTLSLSRTAWVSLRTQFR